MKCGRVKFGLWEWLTIIMLGGALAFNLIPTWVWRTTAPEITVNDYLFDKHAIWNGDTATITWTSLPDLFIRVRSEEASSKRAGLTVAIDGIEVRGNCGKGYFCYKIDASALRNKNELTVVAKNAAGEKQVKVKLVMREDAIPRSPEPLAATVTYVREG